MGYTFLGYDHNPVFHEALWFSWYLAHVQLSIDLDSINMSLVSSGYSMMCEYLYNTRSHVYIFNKCHKRDVFMKKHKSGYIIYELGGVVVNLF